MGGGGVGVDAVTDCLIKRMHACMLKRALFREREREGGRERERERGFIFLVEGEINSLFLIRDLRQAERTAK